MITILCIHVVHINQIMNALRSGQVRSGESVLRAHSEQTVVAHACHGYRYWPSRVSVSGRGGKKGGEGVRGDRLHWWVQGSTSSPTGIQPESVAGRGWFEVLWNLECPVGLSQEKYVRISLKEIWRTLDVLPKNKENCGAT